jgi:hypothetical protein
VEAAESQQAFILDGPLDGLAAGEVHGLREGGGEVDIPLLTGLAADELDLGRETHRDVAPFLSSHITRYQKIGQNATKKSENVFI